jgi:transposase
MVPWARRGARHTKDFEDVVGWLAQRMDKTSVAKFLRCSWETVDRIVGRVVAEHIDDTRLDDLFRIGVDEISYRRGHKYLTLVVNHGSGDVVFAVDGRTKKSFEKFFQALGPRRTHQIEAISMDMSGVFRPVTAEQAPNARIAFDPFHVIQYANKALDSVFCARRDPLPVEHDLQGRPTQRVWRRTRAALRTGAEKLDRPKLALIDALCLSHQDVWLAWSLKEDLREFYFNVHPHNARSYLTRWITKAGTSGLTPMVNLARMVNKHFEGIVTAVELGLSNSRVEGINAKVRLIQRRGYGHHGPDSLIAMIYLCLGGITITLPTQR